MSTIISDSSAIAVDALVRISLVLSLGLILAIVVGRYAALRHAILLSALLGAFLMPAAMLLAQIFPIVRWKVHLPGVDRSATSDVPSPRHRRAEFHSPAVLAHGGTAREGTTSPGAELPIIHAKSESPIASSFGLIDGASLCGFALACWLLGAAIRAAGLGISLCRLCRLVGRARAVNRPDLSLAGFIQSPCLLRDPPRLLESPEVSVPLAAGVIGNIVVVPAGWTETLCHGEMTSVLCHELAHLARRDHRVVLLQDFLATAIWFHPLVHAFNRILSRTREELCDNHVIGFVDRPEYCETLLRLATGSRPVHLRGASPMFTSQWSLEARIVGILDGRRPTETRNSSLTRVLIALLSVVVFAAVALPNVEATGSGGSPRQALEGRSAHEANAVPVESPLTRTFTRSFPAGADTLLQFENLCGRVVLMPGSRPSVDIEATIRVGNLERAEARELIAGIEWIETPNRNGSSRWGLSFPTKRYPTVRYPVNGELKTEVQTVQYQDRPIRISNRVANAVPCVEFDLTISLPAHVHVAIRSAVGPIEGQHLSCVLDLATQHGSVRLNDLRGQTTATSELGDIIISDMKANAEVRTESGGIELSQAASGRVSLTTRSGACRIVLSRGAGFQLDYSGKRPLGIRGLDNVHRVSAVSDGRCTDFLSRGDGGPFITASTESGDAVLESAP
jgi:beta-lactamase regulating signal transducer with metallopeptidase domain